METKHLEQLMLFPMTDEKSTSSSAELHVSMPVLRENKKVSSRAQDQASRSHIPDWLTNWRPIEAFDGISGKMCLTASVYTADETSQRFFQVLPDGRLSRPKADGETSELYPPATKGNFGLCWRVLDVQYARVDGFPQAIPQRRRRIFLVGHLGSWERAAEILLEQRGLLGNRPPQRKKKQAVARTSGASPCGNDGVHASHGGVAAQEAESGAGENQGDDACGRRNADGAGDADCTGVGAFMGGQGAKAGSIAFSEECSPTVKASPSGGNTIPTVMCVHGSQDPIHNDGECANAIGRNQGAETCIVEEPFTGDVSSVIDASYYKGNGTRNGNERPLVLESEKDAFNFEMFSGECKGVSPALQAQRAKDTLVYGTENTANQAEKFEP